MFNRGFPVPKMAAVGKDHKKEFTESLKENKAEVSPQVGLSQLSASKIGGDFLHLDTCWRSRKRRPKCTRDPSRGNAHPSGPTGNIEVDSLLAWVSPTMVSKG